MIQQPTELLGFGKQRNDKNEKENSVSNIGTKPKENFTEYEWDCETVCKEYGDILDHSHSDECLGLPDYETEKEFDRLVLVKNVYRNWDLAERTWAYVEDGKLPEYFSNSSYQEESKVPQRFHKELARVTKKDQNSKWTR